MNVLVQHKTYTYENMWVLVKLMTGEIIPLSVTVNTALQTPIQQALNGEKIVITSHPSSKTQYKQFTLFKSFFL
jgi:hypothetical protein